MRPFRFSLCFIQVKPVRDAVLHALQYWRSLPGPDTPEPSEAGSSIKGMVSSSIIVSNWL